MNLIDANMFMDCAATAAKHSSAKRRKVGCVIVEGLEVVGAGYNHMPFDMDQCCETDGKTNPEVIHAEPDALSTIPKKHKSLSMFVTTSPCIDCANAILDNKRAMVTAVYFAEPYKEFSGVKELMRGGVDVFYVGPSGLWKAEYVSIDKSLVCISTVSDNRKTIKPIDRTGGEETT